MNTARKKILIVVNYFFPYVSGVSEYARAVAKALVPFHDVTVLTGRHDMALPNREQVDGYSIERADPLFFFDKGYVSTDFVSRFLRLAKAVDVVNIHFPMLESGLLAMLTSKPLVLTYQCDMALVGNWISRLAVAVVQLSGKAALSRASRVVVLSKDYAQSSPILGSLLDKVIEVSPPNRFEELGLASVSNASEADRTSDAPFICGFVGRFVEEKGIGTILKAAELLKDQNIEFWLAGDYENVAGGSVFQQLKAQLSSVGGRVRLLGKLSDKELVNFYSKIDTLLLPSTNRFEAFGMVQMESMEFGAMTVTSDMPGVREVVLKTGMGELCEPSSAQSLAEAISRVVKRRKGTPRASVRAKLHEHFSLEKFSRSYLDLVDQVAGSPI